MQLPILASATIKDGRFVTSYPVNLEPTALSSGVSEGQLISTRGTTPFATGPGLDRGGIVWNGVHYRVMGSKLVTVSASGVIAEIGDVGDDGAPAGLDYGFGRLAIRSAQRLFFWNGSTLVDVTDPDLGVVLDMVWIDGYYATTDGEYIVVTDLNDPTSVSPLRYGSAEEDPDAVTGLIKYAEELYAIGRHTIQPMQNAGSTGFPFAVVQGGTIAVGCVSATAKCMVGGQGFAFVGSARGEQLSVWYFEGGSLARLSDVAIDDILNAEVSPENIRMECRSFAGDRHILVHLAGRSLGLSMNTTNKAGQSAWWHLHSGNFGPYRMRNAVLSGGKHIVGDLASAELAVLDAGTMSHFGTETDWQFDTAVVFNPGGMVANEIELFGQFPTTQTAVFLSATRDGVQWSKELSRVLTGRRDERVLWRPNTNFPRQAAFRWRGRGRVAISRAEVNE